MTEVTCSMVKTFTIGEHTREETGEHYCCLTLTDGTKKACAISQLQITILTRARVGEHKPTLYERAWAITQYTISCLPFSSRTSGTTGPQTKTAWRKHLVTVEVPSHLTADTVLTDIFRTTTDQSE